MKGFHIHEKCLHKQRDVKARSQGWDKKYCVGLLSVGAWSRREPYPWKGKVVCLTYYQRVVCTHVCSYTAIYIENIEILYLSMLPSPNSSHGQWPVEAMQSTPLWLYRMQAHEVFYSLIDLIDNTQAIVAFLAISLDEDFFSIPESVVNSFLPLGINWSSYRRLCLVYPYITGSSATYFATYFYY